MNELDNATKDFKLLIFGWIVTVLGIPKMANPDKYNELTDRLYKLYQSHTNQLLSELLEKKKLYPSPLTGDESEYEAIPIEAIKRRMSK